MVRKSKTSRSNHDKTVGRVAEGFKSQDWKVKADIKGYPTPRTIYGRQPDVIATKGSKTRIVEVETPRSHKEDVAQRNAFKRFASLNKNRKFRTKVI
jgi:hypothetical protein